MVFGISSLEVPILFLLIFSLYILIGLKFSKKDIFAPWIVTPAIWWVMCVFIIFLRQGLPLNLELTQFSHICWLVSFWEPPATLPIPRTGTAGVSCQAWLFVCNFWETEFRASYLYQILLAESLVPSKSFRRTKLS